MNSARLRHHPTGIVVTAQERKRPTSEARARAEMEARLDAALEASGQAAENGARSDQIGSGAKADKRRTYRLQDGVVIDHETGRSAQARKVLKGAFDLLW